MKWVSIAVLVLLAVLWPSSPSYQVLLGFAAVCAGAILAAQASRAGKYFWEARYTMVSRKVKYEN
ncbi:MAG: hypothetical protein DMG23_03020 [Acidobacteria bacterium]|nr:MAG: hypothetical protein DMG23_03020 [Acidobacteriota bacterium]